MMRSAINRLFGRATGSTDELPADVALCLEAMSVLPRGLGDDGRPRVLVQFASSHGASGWHHEPERTRQRIAATWPGLSVGQLDRACRAVASKVAIAQGGGQPLGNARSGWAAWRPARSASDWGT